MVTVLGELSGATDIQDNPYINIEVDYLSLGICPVAVLYGEDSDEVEQLRYFRDSILNQTPEGKEIINLYYEWSPVIVEAMDGDYEFKQDVKEMIGGILPFIRAEVE